MTSKEFGVFVSAVSSEFRGVRELIRSDLDKKQWEVKEEESFTQGDAETLLERLHDYIEGCSTVICLIGKRSGTRPPMPAAAQYFGRYASAFEGHEFMPSFTQWEYIFAEQLKKRLLVYRAGDNYPQFQAEAVEDDAAAQQAFDARIITSGRMYAPFDSDDVVRRLVLSEPWDMPAASGVKVTANLTRNGLQGSEESRPRIQVRAGHEARSLSTDTYTMRGREREHKILEAMLTRGQEQFVEVVGPQGVGKKKLLSQFENAEFALVTDPADHGRVEDALQSAWESLVDAPTGTVVPVDRARQLGETTALVFAADVDSNDQLRIFLEAMPRARFCISADKKITDGGRSIELKPLGPGQEEAMIQIFADRYVFEEISKSVEPDLLEICRSVKGNPACIVQQALNAEQAYVAEEVDSIETWVAEQRPLTTGGLPADMQPTDAAGCATTAAVVGEVVPRDIMIKTTSLEATEAAEAACMLARNSPRYSVGPAAEVGAAAKVAADNPQVLPKVFHHTVGWSQMSGATEIYENRSFVVRMMTWGVEHQHWKDVLEIGRNCESALALLGRHGAWEEVLNCSLAASKALDDGAAEGWAVHELGTRLLIRDEMPEARTMLADAYAIRQVHDPEAAEVSRHNLRLVPGALITLLAVLVTLTLGTGWLASVVLAEGLYDRGQPTAEIDVEVGLYEADSPAGHAVEFRIRSVGTAAFRVETDKFDGVLPTDFSLERTNCEGRLLAPGEECSVWIAYVPGSNVGPLAESVAIPLSGNTNGDKRLLLVVEPR